MNSTVGLWFLCGRRQHSSRSQKGRNFLIRLQFVKNISEFLEASRETRRVSCRTTVSAKNRLSDIHHAAADHGRVGGLPCPRTWIPGGAVIAGRSVTATAMHRSSSAARGTCLRVTCGGHPPGQAQRPNDKRSRAGMPRAQRAAQHTRHDGS